MSSIARELLHTRLCHPYPAFMTTLELSFFDVVDSTRFTLSSLLDKACPGGGGKGLR